MPSKSRGIFGSQEAFLNKFSMPDINCYICMLPTPRGSMQNLV